MAIALIIIMTVIIKTSHQEVWTVQASRVPDVVPCQLSHSSVEVGADHLFSELRIDVPEVGTLGLRQLPTEVAEIKNSKLNHIIYKAVAGCNVVKHVLKRPYSWAHNQGFLEAAL